MDLYGLKIFCDTVGLHSFSLAAARNDVTQSAVSQVIRQIETDVGCDLIDRSTRPFQLTAAGLKFYEGCQHVLDEFQVLRTSLVAADTRVAGVVRVAAIYSAGIHRVQAHVQRFQARHPQARVRVEYRHPEAVVQAVVADGADLGLVSYPVPHRALTIVPWRTERMVVVCPPSHALAARPRLAPHELSGETFVGFDPRLRIQKALDRYLQEHGGHPAVEVSFDNVEMIKHAVVGGAGIGILPADTVLKEVEHGALAAIALDPVLTRPLAILHRRKKQLSVAAGIFLDDLQGRLDAQPSKLSRRPPHCASAPAHRTASRSEGDGQ